MAVIPAAYKALKQYHEQVKTTGSVLNATVNDAVVLTLSQQEAISNALTTYWGRQYRCRKVLDLKPRHGYESRVLKDGFSGDQYIEWLVAGCSDAAEVDTDHKGRPRLVVRNVEDHHGVMYDIVVPINSDAHGYVHIAGVIPAGLDPKQKKTAPSAIP